MVKVEELQSNFRSSKTIEVIVTEVYEGKGTQESIGRIVTYYSDLEGNILAVNDPCPGGKHESEDEVQAVDRFNKGDLTTTIMFGKSGVC